VSSRSPVTLSRSSVIWPFRFDSVSWYRSVESTSAFLPRSVKAATPPAGSTTG
jgi:hypothetical protein